MKSCRKCKDRERCAKLCPAVERTLPKELTGKDTHKEINLGAAGIDAALEKHSFELWVSGERARGGIAIDLAKLTARQKEALALLATGMSKRAAARRLNISHSALQHLVDKAKKRLGGCHFAHLMKGQLSARGNKGKGGGR